VRGYTLGICKESDCQGLPHSWEPGRALRDLVNEASTRTDDHCALQHIQGSFRDFCFETCSFLSSRSQSALSPPGLGLCGGGAAPVQQPEERSARHKLRDDGQVGRVRARAHEHHLPARAPARTQGVRLVAGGIKRACPALRNTRAAAGPEPACVAGGGRRQRVAPRGPLPARTTLGCLSRFMMATSARKSCAARQPLAQRPSLAARRSHRKETLHDGYFLIAEYMAARQSVNAQPSATSRRSTPCWNSCIPRRSRLH